MRAFHFWSLVRRCQRPPQAVLVALGLACALVWGWTQAQTNLDKTQQLAMERYGQRAAELVAQRISTMAQRGTPIRAVMLARLGPNVWHDSPAAAMATLEELEETARLWLMSTPRPQPLTAAQIDQLRQTFGAVWPDH